MAGGGANSGRRGGPGARYLRSGGGCCFREPPLAGQEPGRALTLVLAHLSPCSFPSFPQLFPPHPELQNGGAWDGSREPRAGQVTRVAGGGGGAMLRPRAWAFRDAGWAGAKRIPCQLTAIPGSWVSLRRGLSGSHGPSVAF